MGPEYWRAAENVSAVYAKALDAVKSLEALTPLKHVESILSPSAQIALDQQRRIDKTERESSGHIASAIA